MLLDADDWHGFPLDVDDAGSDEQRAECDAATERGELYLDPEQARSEALLEPVEAIHQLSELVWAHAPLLELCLAARSGP